MMSVWWAAQEVMRESLARKCDGLIRSHNKTGMKRKLCELEEATYFGGHSHGKVFWNEEI